MALTCSFIRRAASTCSIPVRKYAGRVEEVIEKYKSRIDSEDYRNEMLGFRGELSPNVCVSESELNWRKSNLPNFSSEGTSVLNVKYLGVWDTVGALGIPASFELLSWANSKHRFHDTDLSAFVKSARHAVAIDERRKDFAPTLWTNLDSLNRPPVFQASWMRRHINKFGFLEPIVLLAAEVKGEDYRTKHWIGFWTGRVWRALNLIIAITRGYLS